ncbi:unnamed protein product [Urochloa decumbens]|uniref:F-box domain-containing protein n=1 Tax=Urochloa decumbens TaxID=240449 RepID=A0ABC9FPN4_9POAL
MALQGAEEGSHPPAAAAAVDPDHLLLSAQWECGGRHRGRSAVVGIGLPDDPLLEILSRLPVKSLFRFKCVSKAWFGFIADRLSKIPQTLQGFFYGHGHFIDLLGGSMPPVDSSFSSLEKLPEIEEIILLNSCNGLVLFLHRRYSDAQTLGYIVCNPATKEWVAVPNSGWTPGESDEDYTLRDLLAATYLIFDPAVSSWFKLVQFCHDSGNNIVQVHTYSSESAAWSSRAVECWLRESIRTWVGSAYINGILHLTVYCCSDDRDVIVAVDREGGKSRIIRWPEEENGELVFLGQSQGHLHCMSGHRDWSGMMTKRSIWVFEDYGTEQWILKDSVSSLQLFGESSFCFPDSAIAIHPTHNMVFFAHRFSKKLVSYDMDSKEVSAVCTLETCTGPITPYFPYFVESIALAKKH